MPRSCVSLISTFMPAGDFASWPRLDAGMQIQGEDVGDDYPARSSISEIRRHQ